MRDPLNITVGSSSLTRTNKGVKSTKDKKVLFDTFQEVWHIQIKIYPETSIVPNYDVFYYINKVRVQTLNVEL